MVIRQVNMCFLVFMDRRVIPEFAEDLILAVRNSTVGHVLEFVFLVLVPQLAQRYHLDPKLRIFNIWVHKLAPLCHLGLKLMIYGICVTKLAW
jgi:hypothetical protein